MYCFTLTIKLYYNVFLNHNCVLGGYAALILQHIISSNNNLKCESVEKRLYRICV